MLWLKRKLRMPATMLAVFDQEAAVARHAGENFFVGIDFADVPEAREQDAAIGGGDHLVERTFCRRRRPD